jgi:hypothetical protein
MKLTNQEWLRANGRLGLLSIAISLMAVGLGMIANAQAVSTTTVQGTVYLANGQPGTGTLVVSWPSFTTAGGQLVAADSLTEAIAPDGFVSVNLAPNLGSTPAGLYYTAIYYLSDGTTSTQYWVVPAAAQASLGQVQAQLMPAAQAVQTVSKAYVDQAIAELSGSQLSASGGTLTGPLTLCCDPTQPMQAADKHYVDAQTALDLPLTGGTATGPLTSVELGAAYQVDQLSGADFGAKLGACISGLSSTNGGTCDARNFSGTQSMGSNLTISTANATVLLPCATISTANQLIVTAGTRNVSLRGCALRGASTASGSQGGTVFLYSGTNAMVQVGDPTYATDTMGFHLDNAVINTTSSTSASAQGFLAYRTQELDLESLYFLGNSNQTGMTLDGTGNYTGGTFYDNAFNGFQTAVNAIGHQISNPATTDWLNASEFIRLHIDCPTSGGNPISGSYGINLQQGDGNTFSGGDVEGCSTALHLGVNAQNNTIVGLRNENSTNQVVADAGSSYNSWITGGTMFTGQLTDNGTRNSFLDTFHRSFNGIKGDWYGSQQDATVTNHYRLGIGLGNERGLMNEIQTDYGYRWLEGYSDATAGEQFYQIEDLLNNVNRISIGQFNNGQSSTNNQTVINSAGTGAVVLNGSNNSGTGGVVIGSGGTSETTVATISNSGNAQFNGSLQVGSTTQSAGTMSVRNNADAEVDYYLWPGLTSSQKGSYTYKDWNGNSQWYMVKDTSNNWALNSAVGTLDSFKAYQSTNSGDTYINTSNSTGSIRMNYEPGSSSSTVIYAGGSAPIAAFTGTTAIKFPGLAAGSGHNCLQIDNSGYLTNTGTACGTGSSNGTVNPGTTGQIAYYGSTGSALSGLSTVPVSAGGTGASTATSALSNLGGAALTGASFTGPVSVSTTLSVANNMSIGPRYDVTNAAFGAIGNGSTDDTLAIQAAFNACYNNGATPHGGIIEFPGEHSYVVSSTINAYDGCRLEGTIGSSGGGYNPPQILWSGPTPGTVYNITGVTIAANTTPIYAASSPAPYPQPYVATFTAANSLSAGQWVDIEGLSSTGGTTLNRGVFQIASATSSSFVAVVPFSDVTTGTFTDSGTATTADVVVAFDANAHYEQEVKDIAIAGGSSSKYQVGFYFGSRIDTGSRLVNTWVSGATEYSYYFTGGGINVDFDNGWRSDAAGLGGIYWRVSGSDSFGISNGTVDNNRSSGGYLTSGAAVVLDNSSCAGSIHFTSRNMKIEANTSLAPGLGVFTLYDCPTEGGLVQFNLDFENTWVAPAYPNQAGFNFPSFVMSPANDGALEMGIINSEFPNGYGSNTTQRFVGLPALTRNDLSGQYGIFPIFSYAPALNSNGAYLASVAPPIQLMDDVNIGQLWQYGVQASDLLYSDTAFAALPNATTLFAGQILAPPAYWNGVNGKRYALDVVYQTGTTGAPNGGATTCTGTSGTAVLTCTSATDLSIGQRISIGTDTNKTISTVNATNPSAVQVNLTSTLGSTHSTATTLTFSAPLLASEIQMPTKTSSAPTTLTWSQGDLEQNSAATVNGVAAWVNVAAGTPGTWAGIPLGNSSGQINSSQISNLAFQSLTTTGTSGAATLSGGVLNIPNYGAGSSGVSSINSTTGAFTFTGSGVSCASTTCTFTGGSMTYPGAGIAVSTGSAWGTSLTAPASAIVGISDTQSLTNKSIAASEVNSGTLGHAQLPTLLSGDIPNNAANTTGTAAGFTGSLSGDVTGTQSATSVGKINGGSVPASSNTLSSNSSSQIVASTSHNLSVPANCSAASGSGSAYTCTTSPTFTPAAGDHIQFRADVANTGSATLAVNGATAATIKKWGGSGNMIANDLLAGHWISATFDGTYWQLEGQLGNANATELNGISITGLTGSGSTLALTTSPVFTTPTLGAASATSLTTTASSTFAGSSNTFNNATAAENDVIVQAGSGAAQTAAYEFSTYAGTPTWKLRMDTSNYLRLNDVVNSLDREVFYQNGQTMINSGAGASAVVINNASGSGTGGLVVYEGGSNNGTIAANLSGTGAATFAGTVTAPTFVGALTGNASTATTASNLSGTPALPNGTTATTQAAADNSTKLATTAYVNLINNTPPWLEYLGTGADGSYEISSTGSCSTGPTHCITNATSSSPYLLAGEYFATSFQIDTGAYAYGNIVSSGGGLVIHSQGACNINGTMLINGSKSTWPAGHYGIGGGSSGGSGGGTAAGTAGSISMLSATGGSGSYGNLSGGAAGAASGGNGGVGGALSSNMQRAMINVSAGGLDGLYLTGAPGAQGGSSGGAAGLPGGGVVMICASINGTGGVIDLSGAYGMPPSANSTGAGSGGGGGVGILSSQAAVTTWPSIYVAGGPGGLVTVPEALATSGSCTTQPKVTLGVTSGALSSCTVAQAGAGCGTGTNVTFNIVGGGGTGGTITPTWSSGALASCTASGGSGYTAATYTTAGTGGDGGNGWYAEYQAW